MSPLYEWRCTAGHTVTVLARYEERDLPIPCECGAPTVRLFPLSHCPPSGVFSYMPNIGNPDAHERKNAKIRGEIPGDAE